VFKTLTPRRWTDSKTKLAATLVILLPPLAASAAQAARSFTVGAVVIRSATVHAEVRPAGLSRLRCAGAALVSVDGAPPHLVTGPESPLPAGAAQVTIHY
jgi:hypothetical protein